MAKRGRKTDYNERIHCRAVEALAAKGRTQEQIADGLGINVTTLKNWRDTHPKFAAALQAGKDATDNRVERSLYRRAMGYTHKAEKIMVVAGQVLREEYDQHYPPDTPALAFWLKNRRPGDWSDKQEIEHSGSISGEKSVEDMTPEEREALIDKLLAERSKEGSAEEGNGVD
jgi:transposase-like protein